MNLRRDVFQAIADPTRRARPTVSKHLQILTECELLEQEQTGREIYYHLNPEKLKEIDDFIEPFRESWETRFSQLDNLLSTMKEQK